MTMIPLPYVKGSLDALQYLQLCCLTLRIKNSLLWAPSDCFMVLTLALTCISGSCCYVGSGCVTSPKRISVSWITPPLLSNTHKVVHAGSLSPDGCYSIPQQRISM